MTDIIAMRNEGYELTGNYCTDNQHVSIKTENNSLETEMYIIGDDLWGNNKISLISISNLPLGDINLDTFINITDIIIAIEHIIDINIIINDHQLLLFDINTDDQLNVTDIIFIIDSIID